MTIDDLAPPLRFDDRGLITAVVQQHDSGEVLMVAWMDREAVRRTLDQRETVFFSRSRQELWHKGATSGNTQRVVDLRVDCDGDTLLVLVDQGGDGVACHTGERSCFHRRLSGAPAGPAAAAPPLADDPPPGDPPPGDDPPRSSPPPGDDPPRSSPPPGDDRPVSDEQERAR